MKRNKPAKRRDRRANMSPYFRFKKVPARYSEKYCEWRRTVTRHAAASAGGGKPDLRKTTQRARMNREWGSE